MSTNQQHLRVRALTEGAMLIAAAQVLSYLKLYTLPNGGSLTPAMFPILLYGLRWGLGKGLMAGFVFGLMQLLFDGAYAWGWQSMILDYLLAFTVLGFGGIYRRRVPHQGTALVLGAVTTGAMRYVLHVIAGCTVWAGLSIPTEAALVYSLAYNATYMVPETLVTALGAWYLSRAVDLREDTLSRAKNAPVRPAAFAVGLAGAAALLVAAVWDVVEIFRPLQDPETGDFIITNLSLVNWTTVGVVTAVGVTVWGILALIRRRLNRP